MRTEDNVRTILGTCWLFADLESRELDRLGTLAVRRRVAAEAVVVRQGELDGDLFIVADGLLRVSVQPSEQRELALHLLRKNDIFGELSLVDGRERSATITAVLPSQLLVLRRADFMDVLSRSPGLAMKLLATMAGHVRRLTARVEDLSVLPVSTRLAKKLLEIADLCGTPVDGTSVALPLTLSQQDLANHIQATRESVNKCIARWQRDSIVYRTQTQIVIHDRDRLRAVVDAG